MNKQRRKELGLIQDRIIALKLDDVLDEIKSINDALCDTYSDEEDAIDNMVDGPRKDDAEEGLAQLDSAKDYLQGVIDALEGENPISLIDDARGQE